MNARVWIPLRRGYRVTLNLLRSGEAATPSGVAILARAIDLEPREFLEDVDRWARNEGLPYGLRVDLDAQTITSVE